VKSNSLEKLKIRYKQTKEKEHGKGVRQTTRYKINKNIDKVQKKTRNL